MPFRVAEDEVMPVAAVVIGVTLAAEDDDEELELELDIELEDDELPRLSEELELDIELEDDELPGLSEELDELSEDELELSGVKLI